MKSEETKNSQDFLESNERFLEFKLGKEMYAIPLLSVKEVISPPETTSIPNSPDYFIGIMNLRGQLITVVDLRKRMAIKPAEDSHENAVVIVNIENIQIGMMVDSIHKVLQFHVEKDMQVLPEVSERKSHAYMKGIFKAEDRLIVLLDLAKILNIYDLKKMAS